MKYTDNADTQLEFGSLQNKFKETLNSAKKVIKLKCIKRKTQNHKIL